MSRLLLLLAPLLLAGCGTQRIALPYRPTGPVSAPGALPPMAVAEVRDARALPAQPSEAPPPADDAAAARLGEIRTGWGYRQAEVAAEAPVASVVSAAFAAGLAQRGALAPAGTTPAYELRVTVLQLDADRWHRLDATADLLVDVVARGDGRSVWFDHARSYNLDASHVTLDTGPVVIAPGGSLGRLAAATLSEAVDEALDRPGLRIALARDAAGPRPVLSAER
ncbi:hypothetical protein M0638_02520 [Roseomonas sp. NAR14]|uniref:Lipoprotein n=1 Tax=Roseomonas acroporae TaxID=2937791 RepID=A0A9X2BUR8_9PROT|nr:hypothetical protein [Roseomonas acroporae]MCK8783254.1 hypothetical protein [Roseomonas acroporae]